MGLRRVLEGGWDFKRNWGWDWGLLWRLRMICVVEYTRFLLVWVMGNRDMEMHYSFDDREIA